MTTQNNEMDRNRPSEMGRNEDTNLRDESALQPGISTVSGSETDDLNDDLTQTAGDDFEEDMEGEDDADIAFDNADEEDDDEM